jgi:uncharacterized delta-60 repeat protein
MQTKITRPTDTVRLCSFLLLLATLGSAPALRAQTPGSIDASFQAVLPNFTGVSAMVVQADGKILVATGAAIPIPPSTTLPPGALSPVFRLHSNGAIDESFTNHLDVGFPCAEGPLGIPGTCLVGFQLAIDSRGRIVLTGLFNVLQGLPRTNLARLKANGEVDPSFVPATGLRIVAGQVPVILPGDKMLVYAEDLNSRTTGLIRLSEDGSVDANFRLEAGVGPVVNRGPNGPVVVFPIQVDGKIWAKGITGLVSLNLDGTVDRRVRLPDGDISSVLVQPDGHILIAGIFPKGSVDPGLLRLNSDGSIDPAFHLPMPLQNVSFVLAQPDGEFILAAYCRNGGPCLAGPTRFRADGSLDPTFQSELPQDIDVRAIARQPDGKWLVWGWINGQAQLIRLHGDGSQPSDSGATGPLIVLQPVSQDVSSGTTLELRVGVLGAERLVYQWQRNGQALVDGGRVSGSTTNFLKITGVQAEDAGTYVVIVNNVYGSTNSLPAAISVLFEPPKITIQPEAESVFSGAAVNLNVTATGSQPISYRWTRDGGVLIETGRISGVNSPTLTFSPSGIEDAGVYSVSVRNSFGSETSQPVLLAVASAPPRISEGPRSQSAALGSAVSFAVQAMGSLPISYQWQFNGSDIADGAVFSGTRSDTLRIAGLSLENLGSYSVTVRNALGWVHSVPAELKTSSAILRINRDPFGTRLSWNDVGAGMNLQRATQLVKPDWQDITASQVVTTIVLQATTEARMFFRLSSGPPRAVSGTELLLHFDEGNPGSAVDASGYGRDGRPVGVTVVPGRFGLARRFVGPGSYISIPGTESLNLASGMTLEAWVRLDGPNDEQMILAKHECGYFNGYFLGMGCGGCPFDRPTFYVGGDGRLIAPSAITDGQWHHLAGVYDGHTQFFYVDGKLVGQQDRVYDSFNSQPIAIGAANTVCLGFKGDIDEVRILNRPLSPGEIAVAAGRP